MSSLRRDVGQLMIMGFSGTEMTSAIAAVLGAIQPAGVILFGRNITGAEQTFELLEKCQSAVDERIFRCVDLEGGEVDRLSEVVASAPAVAAVAATRNLKLFRRHGRVIGEEVRAFGFNVDFAPVLDLGYEASRSVLGTRTVSANAKITVEYAREFLCGLHDADVLGCGKHFPGLGEANLDTHFELPRVAKSFDQMWTEDLFPYRELRRELPFVMVAHAAYPDVTGDAEPASISEHWLTGVLRKKIGYDGLILADDLEMGGVTLGSPKSGERGSIEYAAVETIRAGADMFLMCHNEEKSWRAYEAVLHQAESHRKFRKLVEVAARRVRKLKAKSAALRKGFKVPNARAVAKLRSDLQKLTDRVQREAQA